MHRRVKGRFNKIDNGNFQRVSLQGNCPEAWQEIGGNCQSGWSYKKDVEETFYWEINNTTALSAGIIQRSESVLKVRERKEWFFRIMLQGDRSNVRAYLRIYPISETGDISKPRDYNFTVGLERKEIRQRFRVAAGAEFIRIEVGIMGGGGLRIYKILGYSYSSGNRKRQVKREYRRVPMRGAQKERVQIEVSRRGFYESLEAVVAVKQMAATIIRDISGLTRYSFAVYNAGGCSAFVQAELSPDGIHWVEDDTAQQVNPGNVAIISPRNFLRYTRLVYWCEDFTDLSIWIQAQT